MCMSTPSIPAPAPVEPLPTPPELKNPQTTEARTDAQKKLRQMRGLAGTIATSALGAQGELATASGAGKSLASLGA